MASKLFQRLRVKNPGELAQKAHQAFVRLPYESSQDRIVEELSRLITGIKVRTKKHLSHIHTLPPLYNDTHSQECMFGTSDEHPSKENALIIAYEACNTDLITEMIESLGMLDFETRKDVAQIFGAIMRIEDNGVYPGLNYLIAHPNAVQFLFEGYENKEIALNCGAMFRECCRHEALASAILSSDLFLELFDRLEEKEFEIASDAFLTFKDLLTRHKAVVAAYLNEHYDEFLEQYQRLLDSKNYVTRRQSVKLLGELLLDRANVKAMMQYVSDVANLKQMMILLKDPSKSIQFEAFHVFKVFVANPNKTRPVIEVLLNNRDKLLGYLEEFQTDREDEQFKEEKEVIIKEIADLKPFPLTE